MMPAKETRIHTTGDRLLEAIERQNQDYLAKHAKLYIDTEHFTFVQFNDCEASLLDKDSGRTYAIAATCPGPDHEATLNVVMGERG